MAHTETTRAPRGRPRQISALFPVAAPAHPSIKSFFGPTLFFVALAIGLRAFQLGART